MSEREIVAGSQIQWRKPGKQKQSGRVEWVHTDAHSGEPFYRVRPDVGRRQLVRIEDIKRGQK